MSSPVSSDIGEVTQTGEGSSVSKVVQIYTIIRR